MYTYDLHFSALTTLIITITMITMTMMMIVIIIIMMMIITSGQSNLTTGRIAAAHGRFNGIRQVAPVCIPPNIRFLGPTRIQSPNGISNGSAVFAQLTAGLFLYFTKSRPLKIAHSHGGPWLHLIHGSLVYPSPQPKRHFNRFSRFAGLTTLWQTDRQTTLLGL